MGLNSVIVGAYSALAHVYNASFVFLFIWPHISEKVAAYVM